MLVSNTCRELRITKDSISALVVSVENEYDFQEEL